MKNDILTIEVVSSLSALKSKKNEWTALIDSIPHFLPTMTFEWHYAWLEANQNLIRDLSFLFFYDYSNTLIGIFPFFKKRAKFLFANLNIFSFSGGRDHVKTGIICKLEHRPILIKRTIEYFYTEQKNWDILAIQRLSARKGDDVCLERILTKKKFPYSIESILSIPFIIIKDEKDWESYWKARKKHFRHEIKRKTKKLSEIGNIHYEIRESPLGKQEFNDFLQLENSGWKGKNKSSILHRSHLLRMYEQLSHLESKRLWLVNFKMYVNNRLISSSLSMRTPHGLYVFKIAYDESFNKYSPGILLRLFEVKYCFENGLYIYDFSGKEQKWMRAFTHRKNYVMDFIIYRKTFVSLIRYLGFTKFKPFLKHFRLTESFLKKLIEE